MVPEPFLLCVRRVLVLEGERSFAFVKGVVGDITERFLIHFSLLQAFLRRLVARVFFVKEREAAFLE